MAKFAAPMFLEEALPNVTRKPPGFPGIWVLLTLDLGIFFVYFLAFTTERISHVAMFERGRQSLNVDLAFANTLILISSSYLVVKAIDAARKQELHLVKRYLLLTILCGLAFGMLKIAGYIQDAMAGNTITTNAFYGYYYAITGLHFFHLTIGLLALTACFIRARIDVLDDKFMLWLTSAACFWHLVDMLWVMIFPMFYLLRAA